VKRICIYGKGGIGKSTTVANVAAAMAEMGKAVAVVGCDPKADSTRCLMGRRIPTILDRLHGHTIEQTESLGYRDILCIESGGPQPGSGCAGRGIAAALQEIRERDLLQGRDAVLYDVLGDVVCGGFSTPMREGVADDVYLVTTADFMALYAANNICRGIKKYAESGSVRLAGIIYNGRSSRDDPGSVERFAERVGTAVIGRVPMSMEITKAELARKTVIEAFPDSEIGEQFRRLAQRMLSNSDRCVPAPLSDEEVEALCQF